MTMNDMTETPEDLIARMGASARDAAIQLAQAPSDQKDAALNAAADAILLAEATITQANAEDLA